MCLRMVTLEYLSVFLAIQTQEILAVEVEVVVDQHLTSLVAMEAVAVA